MSKLKTAIRYFNYRLSAKTRYEVHSPFVFSFINDILRDQRHYYAFDEIEHLRSNLLADESTITVEDFGAGSKINKTPVRKVSAIAKNTLITPKFGQLMFRLAANFKPTTVLEIGTSLGVSALYLAKAVPEAQIVTLEGSKAVAEIAANQFKTLQSSNVTIITGELHDDSVVILDDIHWSDEMHQAWETIKKDPAVTLSIDLFFKGIVFFKPGFHAKTNLILQF